MDITVGANTGSKVSYSEEVGIGEMMQMTDVDKGDIGPAVHAEARRAFVEELRWRGESLGPPDPPTKREDEWTRETSCSRDACIEAVHKSPEEAVSTAHTGQSSTDEKVEEADLSSTGSDGAELGAHGTSGGADEHNIDDCYA